MNTMKKPYKDANRQMQMLANELKNSISKTLYDDVYKYINELADQEIERMNGSIRKWVFKRIEKIEKRLEISETTKSARNDLMKEYYKLLHPQMFIDILNKNLHMKHVQETYERFYKKVTTANDFSTILKRYKANESIFKAYSHYVMEETRVLIPLLQNHGEALQEHFDFVKKLAEKQGGNVALKIGAGIVGSLLAGPVGGIASRKVVGSLTNNDPYIEASLQDVRETWRVIISGWETAKTRIRQELHILYFTLIGGYFKKVATDFDDLGYVITNFSRKRYTFKLEVKKSEQQRLARWMDENEQLLCKALGANNFSFAQQLTTNLVQYFSANKTAGKVIPAGQTRTLLEKSQLFRYGVYIYQIDQAYWKQGKYEQALQLYGELLTKLPISVRESQAIAHVPLQSIEEVCIRMMIASVRNSETLLPTTEILNNVVEKKEVTSQPVLQMIQAFTYFVLQARKEKRLAILYQQVLENYEKSLKDSHIEDDDRFMRFLKRKAFLQKLGVVAVSRSIAKYQDFTDKYKVLKLRYVFPLLFVLFFMANGVVFGQTGKLIPPALDRYYFEKVEVPTLQKYIDHSALAKAIKKADMNRVFYLLENANVDERRFKGDLITLLSKAVDSGDHVSVQRLLDYGVDVNAANRDGDTPLSIAVANEDMEMTRLLLEHGANPNEAALIFDVIKREKMAYLDLLMEYGGDINKANEAGLLPIQQAVSDGDVELVKVLLELGADVLQQGSSGHALQIAVNRRQTTMIEFLLEHVSMMNG
nr:ankyrin repeat domain-containing protein [Paenibacillus bovis]